MDLNQARQKMQQALEHLKGDLAQIRTGRANPALVSDIQVDAYDSKLMIKELGQITTPEHNIILITPWDKSIITNIAGGIEKANLGLSAQVEGELIRIVIPPLTTERREQFIKQLHSIMEKFKVEIRQARHEFVEFARAQKQKGEISEDDLGRNMDNIQELHDEFIEAIEVAGKAKEEQLREV